MRSPAIALPAKVRELAESALVSRPAAEELAWMSWAGTVWRLGAAGGAVYVKRARELESERDRMAWLRGRWPVPEVIGLVHAAGDDWLVTRAVGGRPLSDPGLGWPPERVAVRFGEILRDLHAADARGCPFGASRRGHVLVHGDYCLPNVVVDQGELAGVVDLGGARLASPEVDLAAGVWTLQYNFGKGLARIFLDAYGWPPMSDDAIERLRRRYAR